jgi:pimeloyl-ACP methyl ester carboxylesterase
MVRVLKWMLATVAIVLLLIFASYWFSLDRDFKHTAETSQLPLFDRSITRGLVQIEANGMIFRARVAGFGEGSADKPLVVLLHGIPSTSITWVELIPILEAAGYRVVAFDQRGYSPGARPEGIESYLPERRVEDILAIVDAVGGEAFHLVGHDFGAITGWLATLWHRERILTWTGLSSPHPIALLDAWERDPEQYKRSWYVRAIQLPWLPEILLGASGDRALNLGYEKDPERKMREIRKVFAEPGAMTAALNWYRVLGIIGENEKRLEHTQIKSPTLFIWGNEDFSVSRWTIDRQENYIDGPYRVVELDANGLMVVTHVTWTIEHHDEHHHD